MKNIKILDYKLINILFSIILIVSILQGHSYVNRVSYNIIYLLVLSLGFVNLIFQKKKLYLNRDILNFLVIIFITTFVSIILNYSYFSSTSSIKGLLSIYLFFIIIQIFVSDEINFNSYWSIINQISKIATFLLIVQSVLFYFFGIDLHSIKIFGEIFFKAIVTSSKYRPSSIFSEPSHIAEFVLISFYYNLFIKQKFIDVMFLLLGLILSTSVLGIVGSFYLIFIYLMKDGNNKKLFYKYLYTLLKLLFLISFFILIFYILIENFQFDNWVINRVFSGGTINSRVFRSFDIFNNLEFSHKIIGVGLQNQSNFLNYYSVYSKFDNISTLENREYAQTIGYLLVTTGFLGVVSYIIILFRIFIKSNEKIFVSLFLIICLVSNILTRSIFIVYFVMLFDTIKSPKDKLG